VTFSGFPAEVDGGANEVVRAQDSRCVALKARQDAVMRFEHTPGVKLFVDYAGKVTVVAGEIPVAQVSVWHVSPST
jgi:hypothetical protein